MIRIGPDTDIGINLNSSDWLGMNSYPILSPGICTARAFIYVHILYHIVYIFQNGVTSALPYLAMWLLSFPVSWLSDVALKHGVGRATVRKVCNTIGHWGPGLVLLSLCFVPTNTNNNVIPVVMLVMAVGTNAGSICGFQINHIDISPNYAGTLMSITNFGGAFIGIIAPLIVGQIVKKEVYS